MSVPMPFVPKRFSTAARSRPNVPLSDALAARMFRELAILLDAGVFPETALGAMAKLPDCIPMRRVAAGLGRRLGAGARLSEAMEAQSPAFRNFAIGMVRAGEAAGALEVVASRLADIGERKAALREGVVWAIVFPVLMLLVSLAAMAVALGAVLPHLLGPLFANAGVALHRVETVPFDLRDLSAWGRWLLPLAALAAALVAGHRAAAPERRLIMARRVLEAPWLGRLLADIAAVRLLRGLGVLVGDGIPPAAALEVISLAAGNPVVAASIRRAAAALGAGGVTAGEVLGREPWFPAVAARQLGLAEDESRLAGMAARAALILDSRFHRVAARALNFPAPVWVLGPGLLVSALAFVVILLNHLVL